MNTITQALEHSLVRSLGWALIHLLWQATAIAAVGVIARSTMRNKSAHARYVVLCGLLVATAVCPVVTWRWVASADQPLPAANEPPSAITGPPFGLASVQPMEPEMSLPTTMTSEEPVAASSHTTSPTIATLTTTHPSKKSRWAESLRSLVEPALPWFVAAWLAGVLVLSLRMLVGLRVVQRLRSEGSHVGPPWEARLKILAARIRVSRPVHFVESALVDVPTVIGWLRPMLLVPASFLSGMAPAEVEAILIHELAHIRRHDFLVNLLQSTIEVLLFYHPAVWWLSRCIREEREFCCDDIAAADCGGPITYARALTTLEEIRVRQRQNAGTSLTLAADGGSLLRRIRRLTFQAVPDSRQSSGWGASLAALSTIALLGLAALSFLPTQTTAGPNSRDPQESISVASEEPRANAQADTPTTPKADDGWGPVSDGIRCRIVPVAANSNDEAPDPSKPVTTFANADEVTFAVELKNVGDKPVTLLGVRYGESYAGAAGKLSTRFFGPQLFDFEFMDSSGKPVPRAARTNEQDFLAINGASTHALAPGKSLVVLLRPAAFYAPLDHRQPAGNYRVKVRYRGLTPESQAAIKKHWPDSAQASAWTSSAISNEASFAVTANADPAPKLVWGKAKDGLQAAIELQRPTYLNGATGPEGVPTAAPGIPVSSKVRVVFHIKNVGDKPITFSSESARQGDSIHVTDESGTEVQVRPPFYTGLPIMVRWVLKPGEIAQLHVLATGLEQIDRPGKYSIRYTIRFNSLQSKDAQGNVTFPLKDDWQSELETGTIQLFLRPRTEEDAAREKPPTFVGKVEFVGKNGQPVESGTFTWQGAIKREEHADSPIRRGVIQIPECTLLPGRILVRAPGYEEAMFNDVLLTPNEFKRFELTPAAATRFRLVSTKDQPVEGAKIRFFNKTSGLASSGPIPMQGLKGPIWAVSRADGNVTIDTMQKVDPYYSKLGDAVYFFCIESPTAADPAQTPPTRIIGPVKAGQDLGDIRLGPPIEVRGEIRGTLEELKAFAAEWDQPFAMKTDNPDATWDYAVSKTLETTSNGDVLKFHLTGLVPGRLRIISNFGASPKSVRHTYSRRDPQDGDVVVTVDLKESINDLVITPKGQLQK